MFIFIFTLFCIYNLVGFYIFISIERANGEQRIFHELAGWFWPVILLYFSWHYIWEAYRRRNPPVFESMKNLAVFIKEKDAKFVKKLKFKEEKLQHIPDYIFPILESEILLEAKKNLESNKHEIKTC